MRLRFFDNKGIASWITKKTWLTTCLALTALAAMQARADQVSRPGDDGAARPIPGLCCCGDSFTCLHCGCCDPCLPRPWPKPVPLPGPSGPCPWPKPWPKPYLGLKVPLPGEQQ